MSLNMNGEWLLTVPENKNSQKIHTFVGIFLRTCVTVLPEARKSVQQINFSMQSNR